MTHQHDVPQEASVAESWDELYRQRATTQGRVDRVWSGRPNEAVVRELSDLTPGTALDLGCGEGGDAIWLAGRGWRVTAVDVSQVALDRAVADAVAGGVADRIQWQRHDLTDSGPVGPFDLVSACYLHSHVALPREDILRRARDAVGPGGVLLVVGHGASLADDHEHGGGEPLPTNDQVLDSLRLEDGAWLVERSEGSEHTHTGPDGEPSIRRDFTLRVRRTAG